MHIVIVDNGRSNHLGRKHFYKGLSCIRCGACMNTCPVYRRSGGHSYGATVPGPIGSVLSPGTDLEKYSDLPFASTLCGSCTDVCPVKIDLHQQLYKWRQIIMSQTKQNKGKKTAMKLMGRVLSSPTFYKMMSAFVRKCLAILPRWIIYNRFNRWGIKRELPKARKESFNKWYIKHR